MGGNFRPERPGTAILAAGPAWTPTGAPRSVSGMIRGLLILVAGVVLMGIALSLPVGEGDVVCGYFPMSPGDQCVDEETGSERGYDEQAALQRRKDTVNRGIFVVAAGLVAAAGVVTMSGRMVSAVRE